MRMTQQPSVLAVRALAGDPARAAMLVSLLDGRAFSAGELAYASRITAQTARSHLAKLLDGGLLAVETAGRHRYYRLAGFHVAQAIELVGAICPQRIRYRSSQQTQLHHRPRCRDTKPCSWH